jgi:hypothetical protein
MTTPTVSLTDLLAELLADHADAVTVGNDRLAAFLSEAIEDVQAALR